MHGLIGKMIAVEGEREALLAILLGSTGAMPGCLAYVVARDPADANAIWITEVWDSQESHRASLSLPAVKAAIAKASSIGDVTGRSRSRDTGCGTRCGSGRRSCRSGQTPAGSRCTTEPTA